MSVLLHGPKNEPARLHYSTPTERSAIFSLKLITESGLARAARRCLSQIHARGGPERKCRASEGPYRLDEFGHGMLDMAIVDLREERGLDDLSMIFRQLFAF
jgi:hypothetical protein